MIANDQELHTTLDRIAWFLIASCRAENRDESGQYPARWCPVSPG